MAKTASAAEVLEIKPQAGPQTAFLSTSADIAIYGGAAGGGKTWSLLAEPLRHIGNKGFGAVFFRQTHPQLVMEGGIWDESEEIYGAMGATPVRTPPMAWRWPSGAKFTFSYIGHDKERLGWQGAQIPYIGWDQLEHFSEKVFFYLLTRNRSTCGVRPYMRATCNPDADSWIAKFIAWWIDQDTGYAIWSRSGVLRWFVRRKGEMHWADTKEELLEKFKGAKPPVKPLSVTFIPARLKDNKILQEKDPDYEAKLEAQDFVDRERLLGDADLGGNWKVRPESGKVFNRTWFNPIPAAPAGGVECFFWDFAATEKKTVKDDPDYTAGVLIRKVKGLYYILTVVAGQWGPTESDRMFLNSVRQAATQARYAGTEFRVSWEIEPGSAGKKENVRLVQMLAGMICGGVPSQGDKLLRAKALAAQALAGNVYIVEAPWNEDYLTHMHNQPQHPHDDLMDASSGGFNNLNGPANKRQNTSHEGY